MDALYEHWPELWPLIGAGLVALIILAARRCFRRDVFGEAPQRIELAMLDIAMGFCLMFLGMFALQAIVKNSSLPIQEGDTGTPIERAVVPLISQLTTQLPVMAFILWRAMQEPDGLNKLGILPHNPLREFRAGSLAVLAALPIVLGANAVGITIGLLIGEKPPEVGHELLQQLIENSDATASGLLIISAVVFAPVFEEFIFRGLLQTFFVGIMGSTSRWLAIFATSAVFAIIHLGGVPWQVLPGLFCLSLMLGWLYEKHGSLLPCIVLHALFNGVNVVLGFVSVSEKAAG